MLIYIKVLTAILSKLWVTFNFLLGLVCIFQAFIMNVYDFCNQKTLKSVPHGYLNCLTVKQQAHFFCVCEANKCHFCTLTLKERVRYV